MTAWKRKSTVVTWVPGARSWPFTQARTTSAPSSAEWASSTRRDRGRGAAASWSERYACHSSTASRSSPDRAFSGMSRGTLTRGAGTLESRKWLSAMAERLRVLIVEDQPAVAKALRCSSTSTTSRRRRGRARGGAAAIAARRDVGVVVQDMNFAPGGDLGRRGGRACSARSRELRPELPVLLLTAWTSLETAVQLVKEGASDYLAKPWDDGSWSPRCATSCACASCERERAPARGGRASRARRWPSAHDLCGARLRERRRCTRVVTLAVQVAPRRTCRC